jgi:signal transduction histidine kinase
MFGSRSAPRACPITPPSHCEVCLKSLGNLNPYTNCLIALGFQQLDVNASCSQRSIGSLRDALETARDACATNASVRGVDIEIDGAPAVVVAVDGDRLTLVLVNLIDNAVKHGRAGGGVFVSVDVEDKGFVRVTVDDDGPGIAPADRDRVFAFGERAVTVAKGTGIGLAFARLLLERAGGHMALEESPRGGARFVLSVPRV